MTFVKKIRMRLLSELFSKNVSLKMKDAKIKVLKIQIDDLNNEIERLKKQHKRNMILLNKRNDMLAEDNRRMYVKCKRMEKEKRSKNDTTK